MPNGIIVILRIVGIYRVMEIISGDLGRSSYVHVRATGKIIVFNDGSVANAVSADPRISGRGQAGTDCIIIRGLIRTLKENTSEIAVGSGTADASRYPGKPVMNIRILYCPVRT